MLDLFFNIYIYKIDFFLVVNQINLEYLFCCVIDNLFLYWFFLKNLDVSLNLCFYFNEVFLKRNINDGVCLCKGRFSYIQSLIQKDLRGYLEKSFYIEIWVRICLRFCRNGGKGIKVWIMGIILLLDRQMM